jgi:hypothetical protein
MSTLKVTTLQNLSGTEVYTCKALVNFNGTGTVAIRASGNVSSITDNGTGDYTINFTTALADANYAVTGGIGTYATTNTSSGVLMILAAGNSGGAATLMSTTAVRVTTGFSTNTSPFDDSYVTASIFR